MELSPSEQTRIRFQFEAFCKKVLRGERCDYLRQVIRRTNREVNFSDLPAILLERLCIADDHLMDRYEFELYGHRVTILNEQLGDALTQMGTTGRDILLLAYSLDLSDREIGTLLGMSRSAIQRHRKIAMSKIKTMLRKE